MQQTVRLSPLGLQYTRGHMEGAVPSRELPTRLIDEVRMGTTWGSVGVLAYREGKDPEVLLTRRTANTEHGLCPPALEVMPGDSVEETAARLFAEYFGVTINTDPDLYMILSTVLMTYPAGTRIDGPWTGMTLVVAYNMSGAQQAAIRLNTTAKGEPSPMAEPPFTDHEWVPLSQIVPGNHDLDLPTLDIAEILRKQLRADGALLQ